MYANTVRLYSWTSPRRECREHYRHHHLVILIVLSLLSSCHNYWLEVTIILSLTLSCRCRLVFHYNHIAVIAFFSLSVLLLSLSFSYVLLLSSSCCYLSCYNTHVITTVLSLSPQCQKRGLIFYPNVKSVEPSHFYPVSNCRDSPFKHVPFWHHFSFSSSFHYHHYIIVL